MTGIELWSTTAASNNSASPNGWPEGMPPSGVNDSARQMMAAIRTWYENAEWIDFGYTPTYIGATQFSVTGDKTTTFQVGRRVKAYGTTPFTIYGTISASAYASVTTVTVTWDSGSLNGTLTTVWVGASSVTNPSIYATAISGLTAAITAAAPSAPFIDSTAIIKGSADATKLLRVEVDGFTTGTTRVMTPPNEDFTVVGVATTQTLTNKTLSDSTTAFADDGDATKKLAIQCSGVTTGTTRTWTVADKSGTVALTSDLLTSSSTQATTSGTSKDFTSLPAGIKRITIMFSGVSTNGTSNFLIQGMVSGSAVTSGYNSSAEYGGTAASSTAGFIIRNNAAADAHSGIYVLTHLGSNVWSGAGTIRPTAGTGAGGTSGGDKTFAGTLDGIRITSVTPDTFDAGNVNIMYE